MSIYDLFLEDDLKGLLEELNTRKSVIDRFRDYDGVNLLDLAVLYRALKILEYLLKYQNRDSNSLMLLCSLEKHRQGGNKNTQVGLLRLDKSIVSVVLEFLKFPDQLNPTRECNDASPLMRAIKCYGGGPKKEAVIEMLLNAGAHCNPSGNVLTPLHYAAWYGYTTIVQRLLVLGADPSRKSPDGSTPLTKTCQCLRRGNKGEIKDLLLKAGAV